MAPVLRSSPVAPLSPHSSEPAHKYQLYDVITNHTFLPLKWHCFLNIIYQMLITQQLHSAPTI